MAPPEHFRLLKGDGANLSPFLVSPFELPAHCLQSALASKGTSPVMIRTSRLFLRPYFPEDARELCAAIADERVVRMLSLAPWPYTLEDAHSFCALTHVPPELNFAITLPGATGAPIIGGIGIDPATGNLPELGYWIAPDHWQRGYVSEAIAAVLETARLMGMQHIRSSHFVDNLASGCVLLKAGFTPTGELIEIASRGRGGQGVPAIRYELMLG